VAQMETILIDDSLWERLFEVTDGAAALCYQCGVCTASCPWGEVRQEHLSVRKLMRQAQLGLVAGDGSLWLCTTCAQCQAYCPRGVDIAEVFRGLRSIAWEQRSVEGGLPSLLWSMYWNDNPWSQPPSQRSGWAKGLDLVEFDPELHEVLLYVGCTSSYDRRAQKVARALASVFSKENISFGYLGNNEPCCGEAALSVGHKAYFSEIARSTADVLHSKGVQRLVTISPHCYDVFQRVYPQVLGEPLFEVQHYTQYLDQLATEGRINFENPIDHQVTFQDPCYLGRYHNEYEAPRRLLSAIPGVELVEMEAHGVDGLCCGGGGGRMWLETEAGERFSDLRAEQAIQTGADILATACPFCLVCLEDSLKAKKTSGLKALDVAEIVAMAIKG